MKNLAIAVLFVIAFAMPAQALTANSGQFQQLEFVADTDIPGLGDAKMSLCYVTSDFKILGYTLTSNIQGYALSSDGCQSEPDRLFSAEQMTTAQSLNLIDANIPVIARNSLERNVRNYGLWVAIGLGLLAVIIRRIKSLMGFDPRGPMRNKAAQRILSAMCYTAKCDGLVGSNELKLISRTARRLTGRVYQPTDIIRIADHIDMDLSPQDYVAFGKGLRDREKDTMMHAVLFIAVASGRMLPSEYTFVSQLAHGLGMPGEDFRRVLNIALADMDTYISNP